MESSYDYDMEYKTALKDYYDMGYDDGCKKAAEAFVNEFYPRKIIFNGPATIIFWDDGTKTVVKRRKGDKNDVDAAVAQAITKKLYITNSGFHRAVTRACKEGKKK